MDTIQAYAEETAGNVEEVTSGVDEVARAAQKWYHKDAQRLSEEARKYKQKQHKKEVKQ